MELSILCGQHISLAIFDPIKNKLIKYQSSEEYSPKTAFKMLNMKKQNPLYEEYTNDHYKMLCDNKI